MSNDIDVYAWSTTNGLRATVAFAESGLSHRVIPVDLSKQAHKTPEYLAINPAGQIDRKSTRLNSSHIPLSRMPSSA
mgnify:CR=1 FL=1